MSYDIQSFLCNYLQMTHFSIQLDESTLLGIEVIILGINVRVVILWTQKVMKNWFIKKMAYTLRENQYNVLRQGRI